EVLAACERIVVLRDGRKVLDAPRRDHSQQSIIAAMLGKELGRNAMGGRSPGEPPRRPAGTSAPTALRVRDWRVARSETSRVKVGPVEFELRQGEILGLFGPLGAGKTELLHSIYGLSFGLCSGACLTGGDWHKP